MTDLRLAVLIDADNVSHVNIKEILEEIAKYGTPTLKRIYADWTKPGANGWKNVLLDNAITPIQQYGYTTGKNSTDSAMIIDAMDILYSDRVEGFCIVSSDCDFTRLAVRLREAGKKVIGIGEKKTPPAFIAACEKFIYIEILSRKESSSDTGKIKSKTKKEAASPTPSVSKVDNKFIQLIKASIDDLADDEGWASLGDLGNLILKKQPDFDPRNYGFSKFYSLIKSIKGIQTDERPTASGKNKIIYVKADGNG